jgi:hypothetical protein
MGDNIGGIEQNEVIVYLFKIMFGRHFENYMAKPIREKSINEEMIIKGCLRLAWNDAFRHTSINTESFNQKLEKEKDETIDGVLSELVDWFRKYADSNTCIKNIYNDSPLITDLKDIKETEITLGHTQKLFNMAVKYYLCIYMFRNELGVEEIVKEYDFKNADCPIDSVILDSLKEKGLKYNGNWSDIKCIETYKEMQEIISKNTNGCNLLYDFENWK